MLHNVIIPIISRRVKAELSQQNPIIGGQPSNNQVQTIDAQQAHNLQQQLQNLHNQNQQIQ